MTSASPVGLIGAATLLIVNHVVVRILFSNERLERLVEGEPVCLIENGQIREDRLRKELVNVTELETAAHKQGFASLEDVERAVLDPGGGFAFEAKERTRESQRHAELLARLDQVSEELKMLRSKS
jgi:uncharacterized membrane protein YcaP (DUF421 family)